MRLEEWKHAVGKVMNMLQNLFS